MLVKDPQTTSTSERPRVILLAAGQGKRMQALGGDLPKSLLPVKGEPFAVRLVRQAVEHGAGEIVVVVGYQHERVQAAIAPHFPQTRFVLNEGFADDINIGSLSLALAGDLRPFHVVEADIYLDDACWDVLFDPADRARSVWYTRGPFLSTQLGGILATDAEGRLTDLRIVPSWEPRYAGYHKLVGVTKVGPNELEHYAELLFAARARSSKQYYLQPWIDCLPELPAYGRDLGAVGAVSVNTPEEYLAMRAALDD